MRLQAPIVLFVTLFATTASAQVVGYGVAGPAGARGFANTRRVTFNVAGGGEVFLAKYLAVGGEGGFFDRLITVSANGSLHVVSAAAPASMRGSAITPAFASSCAITFVRTTGARRITGRFESASSFDRLTA